MLNDLDSPIVADVEEVIAQAQEAQQQQAEAQAPYQQQLQALEMQKIAAQIAELQAKAQKYSQQGALVEAHTASEQINQNLDLANLAAAQDQGVQNPQVSPTKPTHAQGSKWQKYFSAQHLEY